MDALIDWFNDQIDTWLIDCLMSERYLYENAWKYVETWRSWHCMKSEHSAIWNTKWATLSRGLFLFHWPSLRYWFALPTYCLHSGYQCICLWLVPMLRAIITTIIVICVCLTIFSGVVGGTVLCPTYARVLLLTSLAINELLRARHLSSHKPHENDNFKMSN